MNERIEELLKQSGLWYVSPRQDLMNDFAKLLVSECADVARCSSHVSGILLRNLIKEHFGVE